MPSGVELVQSLVNGVGIGLIYGLIAIGFCVIYNASGIVNFAQGVFVMLGGMFAHTILTRYGLPMWLSAIWATVLVAGGRRSGPDIRHQPDVAPQRAPLFAIILATLAVQLSKRQDRSPRPARARTRPHHFRDPRSPRRTTSNAPC